VLQAAPSLLEALGAFAYPRLSIIDVPVRPAVRISS